MNRRFNCPCCKLPVRVPEAPVGRVAMCPRCRSKLTIGISPRIVPRWLFGLLPLLGFATYLAWPAASEPVAVVQVVSAPLAKPRVIPPLPAAPVLPVIIEEAPMPRMPVAVIEVAEPMVIVEAALEKAVPRYQVRYELAKRLNAVPAHELEMSLLAAKEVNLNTIGQPRQGKNLQVIATKATPKQPYLGPLLLGKSRPELAGLPYRIGREAVLDGEQAASMDKYSKNLRTAFQKSLLEKELNIERFHANLSSQQSSASAACIRQMLQCDATEVRRMSCELLREVNTATATETLVQWAIFDTDEANRAAAVDALKAREREPITVMIAKYLRYPWPPAVEHACEALVALEAVEAIEDLLTARDLPDPEAPYRLTLPYDTGGAFRREVVRINHARNCLLCHAPAQSSDKTLIAAIPSESAPLPPSNSQVYYSGATDAIAAATTYLKQDFSLMQLVKNHGPWPEMQRYDYFVAVRRELNPQASPVSANAGRYRLAYDFALERLGAALPERLHSTAEPDLAATSRFVALQLHPQVLHALKTGPALTALKPSEVEATLQQLQHAYDGKSLRVALVSYFAEAAESGPDHAKAAKLLAVVRGSALDVDLPGKLAKAAK